MYWKTVLKNWKNGKVFTYPKKLKHPFMWRTSIILYNKNNNIYKEEFIENKRLDVKQNYTAYKDYIKKSKNKYVTSFMNLSGDTLLIIPMPRKNKNFATIKHFTDNASLLHQKKFWMYVEQKIKKELKKYKKLYVSTHGLGVSYLHVRLSHKPIHYYHSKVL